MAIAETVYFLVSVRLSGGKDVSYFSENSWAGNQIGVIQGIRSERGSRMDANMVLNHPLPAGVKLALKISNAANGVRTRSPSGRMVLMLSPGPLRAIDS
jgi:hypothetical protein